jgi:hypothetical protein
MITYIYVIGKESGPCKVGISKSPHSRAVELQTGCPFKISVLYQRECRDYSHARMRESIFHEVYEDLKIIGEWFDIDADLAIEGVDTGFDLEAVQR